MASIGKREVMTSPFNGVARGAIELVEATPERRAFLDCPVRYLLAAVMYLCLIAPASQAKPLPIETAFDRGYRMRPELSTRLSPDGQWLSYCTWVVPAAGIQTGPQRYSATGLPEGTEGTKLHVLDHENGQSFPIGEPGSSCFNPSWSHDGRTLAFLSDAGGEVGLWVQAVPKGRPRRLGRVVVVPQFWGEDHPLWLPGDRSLLVGVKPVKVLSEPVVEPKVFLNEKAPPAFSPIDQKQRVEIVKVDLDTGYSSTILSGEAYFTNGATLSSKGLLSVTRKTLATNAVTSETLLVDPSSGKILQVIPKASDGSWHPSREEFYTVAEGQLQRCWPVISPRAWKASQYWFSSDRSSLWLLDGGTLSRVMGRTAETYHIPSSFVNVSLLSDEHKTAIESQGRPLLTARLKDTDERCLLRATDESVEILQKGYFKLGALAFPIDDNGGFLSLYQDPNTAPEYYRFSPVGQRGRPLTAESGELGDFAGEIRQLDLTVDDKTVRCPVLLPAENLISYPPPAVCFIYGGSRTGRAVEEYAGGGQPSFPASVFLSRGYAVVYLDTPLNPASDQSVVLRELWQVVQPQLDAVVKSGWVDEHNINLLGQSFGGYSTAAVLTQSADRFAAGVAIAGIYDPGSAYGWLNQRGISPWKDWADGYLKLNVTPFAPTGAERYTANSPYYHAAEIETPLLLLHGELDDGCPVGNAGMMYLALSTLDSPTELAIYPTAGHIILNWSPPLAKDAVERILLFLNTHRR